MRDSKWKRNMKFRRNTLVLAGNNTIFLKYLAIALKRMGFEVIPAENGLEAMNLTKIFVIDAVILDVNMPVSDGIETLKRMKEDSRTSGMPVIMVSAHMRRETIEECKRLGCTEILTKPVSLNALHEILQKNVFPSGYAQRQHFRVLWNREVTVTLGEESYRLFTENLSERGMYVRIKEPFPVDAQVEVSFPLREGKHFTLRGSVIYTRAALDDVFGIPPGMGIEFRDLTDDTAKNLKDYVTELLEKEIVASHEEKSDPKTFPLTT